MSREFDVVAHAIRHRRSVFPGQYTGEAVSREEIGQLLELANWAPNHKKTEPWRFIVFREKGLEKVSEYMLGHYDANTPEEARSEMKRKKMGNNPLKAGAIVAIVMARDPEESLPEWEELAAVACAVENMWIAASAMGLGAYWSTPRAALEADDFLGLAENERCLGWFYIGRISETPPDSERLPVASKTQWIEA